MVLVLLRGQVDLCTSFFIVSCSDTGGGPRAAGHQPFPALLCRGPPGCSVWPKTASPQRVGHVGELAVARTQDLAVSAISLLDVRVGSKQSASTRTSVTAGCGSDQSS